VWDRVSDPVIERSSIAFGVYLPDLFPKEDLAMTVLTRWEPFREFATLQDRINRVFRDSYAGADRDESLTTSSFAPAVDVYEDEHKVTLKIEVPGI